MSVSPKTPQPTNPAALQPYLDEGWQLIPLHQHNAESRYRGRDRKDGKRPLDFNWTTRAYDSGAVASEAARTGRNVGVRLTPAQLVIDVDPRNGGTEGFERLCADLKLDRTTWPHVVTGSGGSHYYMSKPQHIEIVDSLKAYKGVEFKSRGRQVLGAGSIHPDALKHYVWDDGHPDLSDAPACPKTLLAAIKRPKREGITRGGQYTQEQIAKALDTIDPAKYQDHGDWLGLMMAVHHASGGDARQEFIEWSCRDPKFAKDDAHIGGRWDSLHAEKNDGYTYKTLLKALRDHGDPSVLTNPDAADDFETFDEDDDDSWMEGGTDLVSPTSRGLKVNREHRAMDTIENAIAAVAKSGLDIAWDDLKQNAVVRTAALPWDESFGRVLNDHMLRVIRHYFLRLYQGVAYQPGKENLLDALLTLAYENRFNPVAEYLNGLKWDGVPRVEKLFADYFNCGNDAYTRAVSRCFMIGAVRRQRQPGCKFDTAPVLHGRQGWGKSSGVRTLFGADWSSDADLGNLRDKDSTLKLRGIWVQELCEIDSLTRVETGTLKAFFSRATDRQRDPYGRIVEDVPRRCVFVATVNEGGYLKDATGARRFWPLEMTAPADLAALTRDRDQLWAEAAALEAEGASDVLPTKLWPVAAERQANQTSDDPWADVIATFLEHRSAEPNPDDGFSEPPLPANKVHTSELYAALDIHTAQQTRDKAQRLRTVMESTLGWRHKDGVRIGSRAAKGYERRV